MLWELILFLAAGAFTALGLVNQVTAPYWVALTLATGLLAVAHRKRRGVGRLLVRVGMRLGGPDTLADIGQRVRRSDRASLGSTSDAETSEVEQRAALRAVREAVAEAMAQADQDRQMGTVNSRQAAVAAANRAGSTAREITDEVARTLVLDWKQQFESIPKGQRDGGQDAEGRRLPLGYPQPAWGHLQDTAEAALDRLGVASRERQASNDVSEG